MGLHYMYTFVSPDHLTNKLPCDSFDRFRCLLLIMECNDARRVLASDRASQMYVSYVGFIHTSVVRMFRSDTYVGMYVSLRRRWAYV